MEAPLLSGSCWIISKFPEDLILQGGIEIILSGIWPKNPPAFNLKNVPKIIVNLIFYEP
jgi:hypothetical protein